MSPNPQQPTGIVRITCEACGARMNPHAEKAASPTNPSELERYDSALGGVIRQIHQCPNCGRVQEVAAMLDPRPNS